MEKLIFIFDTETSDLVGNSLLPERHQPKITEFYGALYKDGVKVDEIDFLCDIGEKLHPKIISITNITDAMLKGQPKFGAKAFQVASLISQADEVVAHNLSFDLAVVNTEFARITPEPIPWPKALICTVEATEWLKGYRLSLSALHELLFGEPFKGAHRARVDVEALARCFFELRNRGYV